MAALEKVLHCTLAVAFRVRRRVLRRVAFTLLVAWAVDYLRSVRRIKLHIGKASSSKTISGKASREARQRLQRILHKCPSLAAIYWPTWYAHTALQQFLVLGWKEFRVKALQPSPYVRQVLTLRGGTKIALDWILPLVRTYKDGPVCVLLHGAVQDSSSVTMIDLGLACAKLALPVVVMNRRGYGGMPVSDADAQYSMFGFDEDLDEVLKAVAEQEPGRPVAIIGFSCGSGFSGRYVGNRSNLSSWISQRQIMSQDSERKMPRILCGVVYDPGYDVGSNGAVARMAPPWSWILNLSIKYCYGWRHWQQVSKRSESCSNLLKRVISPKHGIRDTYRTIRRFSGVHQNDSSAWLDLQQPKLEKVEVPCLFINSRDDPICVWANVEASYEELISNPNLALCEMQRGSHGCKFGFWGWSSMVDQIIPEFVMASWQEHNKTQNTRNT